MLEVCCLQTSPSTYLSLLLQVFKEDKYLKEAVDCGEVIWQRGLLRKGYGICHGTAGNGYAFLSLYRTTREKKYLYRACKVTSQPLVPLPLFLLCRGIQPLVPLPLFPLCCGIQPLVPLPLFLLCCGIQPLVPLPLFLLCCGIQPLVPLPLFPLCRGIQPLVPLPLFPWCCGIQPLRPLPLFLLYCGVQCIGQLITQH